MSYLRLAAAAVLAGSVLSACSLGDDGPDSDAIARAYETGDFSDIVLSGTSPGQAGEEYERILAGMGDREPKVSASDAAVAEETASVEMTWDWPIDGETWSYETEISLTRSDDEWEVTWEPSNIHSDLGESPDRLDAQRILAKRGKVVGSDGPLMEERPIVTYGIDKARVNGTAAAVRSGKLLARKLDIDAGDFAEQISKAGSSAFVEAVTYRKSDAPVSPGEVSNIIGVVELQGTRMLAPSKEFAAPVLGKVGPVTAEILEEHPDAYEVGDEAGVTGLQARYDEQMRGAPGMTVDVIRGEDGTGGETEVFRTEPTEGKSLEVTLSRRLQSLAERSLKKTKPASALVALRPSDGAILAAANGEGNDGVNIATFGQAAPGSTFKTATTLALLRAGLEPSSKVSCPKKVTVDGKPFRNDSWYPEKGLGKVPLTTAVAHSCNTAMINGRGKVSHAELAEAAASLGFGVDHDIGFPAFFGGVPSPGSATGHAAELIGQGKVLASPMAMATMIGSIQAGKTVVPRLVTGVDGLETDVPDKVKKLTSAEARQLQRIFRRVVTNGTGRGLDDIPGKPVIAKTGTAEFDRGGKRLTHTWMIAAQGDLAVAAFVDRGENGASTAGPIVERFLRGAR